MSINKVKLNISNYFENKENISGESLIVPGVWAIITMDANNWGYADVKVVVPDAAKNEYIESPEDLLVYFKEGLDIKGGYAKTNFDVRWENGTKSTEVTTIGSNQIAEISYGGYNDNGVIIQINKFMFKDVTIEKIKNLVENTFSENMKELISDIEEEVSDSKEYAKNPSAYYGISNSDFVKSSSGLKRRFN